MTHRILNRLEIVAIVLLIGVGAYLILQDHPTRAQTTIGGFLFGTAVTTGIDRLSRARAAANAAEDRRRQDRDETRKLIYAAAVGDHLAGTVMNAVMHHWRAYNYSDALALAIKIRDRQFAPADAVELTTQLTSELGDKEPDKTKSLDLGPAPSA